MTTNDISDRYGSPPQPLPVFVDTKESIFEDIKSIHDRQRALLDRIASSFTPDTATFKGVVEAIARDSDQASLRTRVFSLYQKVSSDSKLRESSTMVQQAMANFYNESIMRQDIFILIDALYQKRNSLKLSRESLRLLELTHHNYILHGLGIPAGPQRDRLKDIKKRVSGLQAKFNRNLNEENCCIWFTPEELEGVPNNIISNLDKGSGNNEGKLRLTFKYPELYPTLKYAVNPETRKRLTIANENKCNQNSLLFKETIVLREEMARLLGYKNYSSLTLIDRMAKSTHVVTQFLDDLRLRLTPEAQKELDHLKNLKAKDCKIYNIPNDHNYYQWDHKYYTRLLTETEYQVDELQVSEYFPLDATIAGMLNIFTSVMGFIFIKLDIPMQAKLSPTGKAEDVTWHPDVIIYSVWNDNSDEDSEGDSFIGYLYMDLHPRLGKYGHACNTNFQPGFSLQGGTRHYPATALICNFSPPTIQQPISLLKHHEVVTLFHELGHAMHSLAAKTLYGRFHGTAVAWDFVEAPSQMLELWCWTPTVLKSLSQHWSTKEQIPDDLVQKLVSTEKINMAITNLIQVHYSLFDMACHNTETQNEVEAIDPSSLFNKYRVSVTLIKGLESEAKTSDWGHGDAIFGHLMSGYESTYYGYLYSKVIAMDIFHSIFKQNPMDKKQGRRYRHCVLEYGGGRDELESLTELLGREPNSDAFYRELGITD